MSIPVYVTHHLIKGEDLNHHGTLFAGRSAEWFVESGFIAAAAQSRPENVVCLKIHGMCFTRPVHKGEVVRFDSRVVFTGRSRMIAQIQMKTAATNDLVVDGFITFIHVDDHGKAEPHGIVVMPETSEEIEAYERAKGLE
jgi:acyl-CoA hydrolase